MSEYIKKATEKAERIFSATEDYLDKDWDRKETLQFPVLLAGIVSKLKVDPKLASEIDPYMRNFVREHPAYYVSRGAKGGIMPRAVYEARVAKKAQIESAKNDLKAQVAAKVASKSVKVDVSNSSVKVSDDAEVNTVAVNIIEADPVVIDIDSSVSLPSDDVADHSEEYNFLSI